MSLDALIDSSPWWIVGLFVFAMVGNLVTLSLAFRARRRRFHQRPPSLSEQLVRARLDRLQQAADRGADAA